METVVSPVVPKSAVVSSSYASKCSVQYTMTYGYSRYHSWANNIQFNQNGKGAVMNGATLYFRVRAASDAHILLTKTDNASMINGQVYEVREN